MHAYINYICTFDVYITAHSYFVSNNVRTGMSKCRLAVAARHYGMTLTVSVTSMTLTMSIYCGHMATPTTATVEMATEAIKADAHS